MADPNQEKKKVNLPEEELSHEVLTRELLERTFKQRLADIYTEMAEAFEMLKKFNHPVTFFGSSRFTEDDVYYKQARRIASRLAEEGHTIVTGGGPGIMEAANRGALEAGGHSVGFNIELPTEQNLNPYTTDNLGFHYFFTRKVALSFAAEAYIYFPGGYGTMDEFFEILTLIQTKKVPACPIILVGSEYWIYVEKLIRHEFYEGHKAIDKQDLKLYTITDDDDEVIDIVSHTLERNGKR